MNCTRSKRTCKGYGLKLAWPDKFDGRRKQKRWNAEPENSATRYVTRGGKFAFLNTAFEDIEGKKVGWGELARRGEEEMGIRVEVPRTLSFLRLGDGEAELLRYYDSVVARMITTIDDDTNGFRLDLIPMALSASDSPSQSLLQATLALSSFHAGREEEALSHKVKAIKLLSDSLQQNSGANRMAQFSTCMMLCVYSVFDSSDTTWNMHLQGAKSLKSSCCKFEQEYPAFVFLNYWLEYHDVFSAYSYPAQTSSEQRLSDIILPESTPATQKIIGLLGCSTELLRIISCINQFRVAVTPAKNRTPPPYSSTVEFVFTVRERLVDLRQEILVQPGETSGTISHTRITLTAELYRLAALLYLYRNAPSGSDTDIEVREYSKQGLVILEQMDVCTSPWPLFILACNACSDTDRIKVMRIIEEGGTERRVGNYQIIRSLVQKVWKQHDLRADGKGGGRIDWRDLIEVGSTMPSFI
ncbi:hypothetical protein P280DRAFT_458462 [Massarina eburnea CBS 473.64]|uniref:Uncharacterized protein n=1 Tax=Massarina eburnea CBS 473.64 TaxID=1395130 RepID=A0A6A6RSM2_9PLEO|nr:hypothetical protein P280DRAFT_458462 [Massarina eburnea CBS 473.64]